jgi:hypothetical protein
MKKKPFRLERTKIVSKASLSQFLSTILYCLKGIPSVKKESTTTIHPILHPALSPLPLSVCLSMKLSFHILLADQKHQKHPIIVAL